MRLEAFYSTITGNTKKLADGVKERLSKQGIEMQLNTIKDASPAELREETLVLFFWCRKGNLDPVTQKYLERCQGKHILAIGTMGAYPSSEYGDLVRKNVAELISERNHCVGVFLSQGKIDIRRTEYRRRLPEQHPHHLDERGLRRHEESRKHPNIQDMDETTAFLIQKMSVIVQTAKEII